MPAKGQQPLRNPANPSSTVLSVVPDLDLHDMQAATGLVPESRTPSTNNLLIASMSEDRLEGTQDHDSQSEDSDTDEGEHPDALANALESASSSAKAGTLVYSGEKHYANSRIVALIFRADKHGALGFLSDLLSPEGPHESTHSFIPRGPSTHLKAHDMSMLESIGAFTLPKKQVSDRLIVAFFHHVYPFLPVVDASTFLQHYAQQGCNNTSLLLLWSMFLAAANVRQSIAR